MSNQKMIIALLGVVAVLLVAIVGVLLFKPSGVPNVDSAALQTQQQATTGTGTPPPGMGGGATSSGPFDPKTATKADGDPKSHVEKYFNAIVKKDYATAFKLLPKDKQAGGQEAFAQQIAGYGMDKFTMGKADIQADKATVEATANTSGGPFTYIWTFVKVDGSWLVESRKIGGMGQ